MSIVWHMARVTGRRRLASILRPAAIAGLVAVAGTTMSSGAQAQMDWFRPPGNVGQPSTPQRQTGNQQQRQQFRPAQQPRQPQQQQQQQWKPLFPFFDIFRNDRPPPQRYAPPPVQEVEKQRPRRVVQEAPAEPRGTVFEGIDSARKAAGDKPPTDIVLVIGDENAAPLAQGLADAFAADRPSVAVIGKGRTGTGLSPGGDFDWVANAAGLVQSEDATAAVVFIGANDLRPIQQDAEQVALFDDRWRDLYGQRIDAFLTGLKARGKPVAVVGLPPLNDNRASERNATLNELLKERTERAGLIYVDIWDGFVDENGKFLMSGPAVDGQRRRLRAADGSGFTRAGGRKLAFFVDRAIGKLLSGGASAPSPGNAPLPGPEAGIPSIMHLTGVGAGSSARALAGAVPGDAKAIPASDSAPAKMLLGGDPLPAVAGRADDFRWKAEETAAPGSGVPAASPAGDAAGQGTPASTANP
ncbi:SGNH/GDSL hydrolase family protein [Ancylobacter terrae]|uniref:SGNH/GDSL hydrolase family protein n=1 Tax=Ancylobacter sp. sgz301288 TaxID=3342077 RepID=UPI00385C8012